MKSNFSKTVPFTPEWNGNKDLPEKDQLRVTLKPMPLGDLLSCTEALSSGQLDEAKVTEAKKKNTAVKFTKDDTAKMKVSIETLQEYIPKFVTIDQGAEDFTLDEVVKYSQFSELANELIGKLVEISSPNKADIKN
jgi:hypothetical protein